MSRLIHTNYTYFALQVGDFLERRGPLAHRREVARLGQVERAAGEGLDGLVGAARLEAGARAALRAREAGES